MTQPSLLWDQLPEPLRKLPQWCLAGADKAPKLVAANGLYGASPIKGPWLTYGEAIVAATKYNTGIGFIITKDDPFTCIDLDVKDVTSKHPDGTYYTPEEITKPDALEFYRQTAERFESYTELSSSGQGIHIWVEADVGEGRKGSGLEIYSRERFIVCTGNVATQFTHFTSPLGTISATISSAEPLPIYNKQGLADQFAANLKKGEGGNKIDLVEIPEEYSDSEIWERAKRADNADKFVNLCNGDYAQYNYPSQSEADTALLSMFTFYSKSNDQCRRLFRATKLGLRPKAVKNNVYIDRTLRLIRTREARDKVSHDQQIKVGDSYLAQFKANLAKELEAPALAPTPTPIPTPAIEQIVAPVNHIEPPSQVHQLRNVFEALADAVITATQTPHAQYDTYVLPTPPRQSPAPRASEATFDEYDEYGDLSNLGKAIKKVYEFDVPEFHHCNDVDGDIDWPPGLVGGVAKYIYSISYRPIKVIAITAAIGLMGAMTGKCYNISQNGLNLYIMLIARSGVGKEGISFGIGKIIDQLTETVPEAGNFVVNAKLASGPALTKQLQSNPSFLQLGGEFGNSIKRMGAGSRDAAMAGLKETMTENYQRSGKGQQVGGIKYSDSANDVGGFSGVAYSFIGECTPEKFRESLTEEMMEDGFLSRFNIIEYDGERGGANERPPALMGPRLANKLGTLAHQCDMRLKQNSVQDVERDAVAEAMLDKFNHQCDAGILESGTNESKRQVWNRAHLKVLRISALMAVADDYMAPTINEGHVHWAIAIVMRDVTMMKEHVSNGNIGTSDRNRELKLIDMIKKYIIKGEHIGIPKEMTDAGIIPRKHMQNKASKNSSFTKHSLGIRRAFDDSVKSLIETGAILAIPQPTIATDYPGKSHGSCYKVLNLDGYAD